MIKAMTALEIERFNKEVQSNFEAASKFAMEHSTDIPVEHAILEHPADIGKEPVKIAVSPLAVLDGVNSKVVMRWIDKPRTLSIDEICNMVSRIDLLESYCRENKNSIVPYTSNGLPFAFAANLEVEIACCKLRGGHPLPYHGEVNGAKYTMMGFSADASTAGIITIDLGEFFFIAKAPDICRENSIRSDACNLIALHSTNVDRDRVIFLADEDMGAIESAFNSHDFAFPNRLHHIQCRKCGLKIQTGTRNGMTVLY